MYFLIRSLCETSAVLKTIKFLSELLKIVLFLIPMILIVMVSIDIGKAVIANDESEMKKAGHTAIRRIIMGMFLILIPRITVPLISLLVNASSTITNYNNCIENMKNISLYEKLEQSEREEEQETYQKKLSKKTSKKIKAMEKANNTTLKANNTSNSTTQTNNNSGKNIATSGQGLWVAHMKNNKDKVAAAIESGFWGIEVDVHQDGKVFKLYHDSKNEPYKGYNLDEFLKTCKQNNKVAVLHLKSINSFEALVNVVKKQDMQGNTIYQTSINVAKKLNQIDSTARVWVLIGDNHKDIGDKKISELKEAKNYIEGVNMLASNVDKKDISKVHDLGLTICSFSYLKTMYDDRSAATLRSWGSDYLSANEIDE